MIARAMLLAAIAVCCLTAGCENSLLDRSLVFFTNTTLGVEISVSPSDATAPVKLIIGYKRAEGVLNPVYHSQGVEAPVTTDESEALTGGSSYTDEDTSKSGSSSYSKKWSKSVPIPGGPKTIRRYRTEAYSVIAKIAGEVQGKAGGSADGKLSVAQWFATGEAAILLANQPGIAGAVTGSSEIAKEAVQQARYGAGLTGEAQFVAVNILWDIWSISIGDEFPEDARQTIEQSLSAFAREVEIPEAIIFFEPVTVSKDGALHDALVDVSQVVRNEFNRIEGFQKVLVYRNYLSASRGAISVDVNLVLITEGDTQEARNEKARSPSTIEQNTIVSQRVVQTTAWNQLREQISRSPLVIKAVRAFNGALLGTDDGESQ